MAQIFKTMLILECERCTHRWQPRDPNKKPRLCPKCKSSLWSSPRVRAQGGGRKKAKRQ